jgi:hypothetical protein
MEKRGQAFQKMKCLPTFVDTKMHFRTYPPNATIEHILQMHYRILPMSLGMRVVARQTSCMGMASV